MKSPLVLLHGWGVNSRIWKPILPELQKSFDVIVLDLPGYGEDVRYSGDFTLECVTERLLAAAPRQAYWAAWSLGATIAMKAALQDPSRFLKLQLISPTPKFLADTDWKFGMDEASLNQLANLFDVSYEKGLKKFLLLQLNGQANARETVREQLYEMTQIPAPAKDTLRKSLSLLADSDLRSEAGSIQVPTQIVAGTDDQVVSASASRWLSEALPDSEFVLLDSGHLSFISMKQEYLSHLRSFIKVAVA